MTYSGSAYYFNVSQFKDFIINRSNLEKLDLSINNGWLKNVECQVSSHFDLRECPKINLLVIHNISLPAGNFGGDYITDLFMGRLDPKADKSFEAIYQLRVSAHCLIRRDGKIIQYVAFNNRAWHAGVSIYQGREKCNDFSIGIELEGCDDIPYTDEQYHQLTLITQLLQSHYPDIKGNITGHSDIAPGRKTDPGPAFDWQRYRMLLATE